jgi:site-specific DNA-methyltransferase (adenine-specific)
LRPYLPEVPEWVEEMIRQRTIESENFKKREVIGTKSSSLGGTVAAGERNQEIIDYHKNKIVDITAPATAAAKQWQGWGTALKPAHEPMVLARKPLIGTVANNVLTYGTGGLNIDGTRVEGDAWTRPPQSDNAIYGKFEPTQTQSNPEGRFPANFIHDGSDEVVALFPGTKSGTLNRANITAENNTYGARPKELTGEYEANSGSAARFFYCAKASKRDRNEGLDGFEAKQVFGDEGGTYQGLSNSKLPSANHHPTVKPTSLMQYLVRLVTPPNGIVLDPFMGSGSTGKACAYENFDFIGIDQSAEYVEIARARIFFAIATNDEKLPL